MTSTFAALFLAHVLADYVFQTRAMVADKRAALGLHTLHVLLASLVVTGAFASPALYALALAHFVIDWAKTRLGDGIGAHLADQIAHLATLALAALLVPDLWATGAWGAAPAWVPDAMLIAAGAIYATRAGGFAVGKLMGQMGDNPMGDSLPNGGMWIGLLERGLIFLLILGDMAAGIGFLVAAKSVLRFDAAGDGKRAEWVIIGTLASFGWAIAVTIAVKTLLTALP